MTTKGQPCAAPIIAVTMGDPLGIGPEVTVKALHTILHSSPDRTSSRFIMLGMDAPLRAAAQSAGIRPFWHRLSSGAVADVSSALVRTNTVLLDYAAGDAGWLHPPARPTAEGGTLSFRFVDDAITLAMSPPAGTPRADAVVTAPINKAAWAMGGHDQFPGHTELFSRRCDAARTRMMFVAPGLRTILVTTHIALARVPFALTERRVYDTIALGAAACARLGVTRPRVAVCGLNPHASENGLFGDEEQRIIEPATRRARDEGIEVTGPHPADTVFNAAVKGRYDLVVAMYHDQGLIPVKLLAFDRAVNSTIGLPFVRTSPDHGTAYDIAGTNRADPGSMIAAIELAVQLCLAGRKG